MECCDDKEYGEKCMKCKIVWAKTCTLQERLVELKKLKEEALASSWYQEGIPEDYDFSIHNGEMH